MVVMWLIMYWMYRQKDIYKDLTGRGRVRRVTEMPALDSVGTTGSPVVNQVRVCKSGRPRRTTAGTTELSGCGRKSADLAVTSGSLLFEEFSQS